MLGNQKGVQKITKLSQRKGKSFKKKDHGQKKEVSKGQIRFASFAKFIYDKTSS